LVRGYEVRRSDSFNLLTQVMMETFNRILEGEQETAVRSVLDLIARIRKRNVTPLDLVISRSCKGHIDRKGVAYFTKAYDYPDRLPYVRAAKKRIKAGLAFTPGMKIGWLVTDSSTSPMQVVPWLVEETGIEQDDYDPEFYAKRVATAMGRITEAFGWNADDLLKGNRQTTLFSF
jgi:DNA polymerase I